MNKPPLKPCKCNECGTEFTGPPIYPTDRNGVWKVCPNGHYTRAYYKSPKVYPTPSALAQLRELGVQNEQAALRMSLESMVESYERLIATAPEGSHMRKLVLGAFGYVPEMSSRLLKGE